mmetsp:Transcript_21923/g.85911  ORF Transcript_21923/g.85911 Transcript_21923/m.85911 type:complete len:304 (-) Transcript_21923:142-1053(-)
MPARHRAHLPRTTALRLRPMGAPRDCHPQPRGAQRSRRHAAVQVQLQGPVRRVQPPGRVCSGVDSEGDAVRRSSAHAGGAVYGAAGEVGRKEEREERVGEPIPAAVREMDPLGRCARQQRSFRRRPEQEGHEEQVDTRALQRSRLPLPRMGGGDGAGRRRPLLPTQGPGPPQLRRTVQRRAHAGCHRAQGRGWRPGRRCAPPPPLPPCSGQAGGGRAGGGRRGAQGTLPLRRTVLQGGGRPLAGGALHPARLHHWRRRTCRERKQQGGRRCRPLAGPPRRLRGGHCSGRQDVPSRCLPWHPPR